ncbi:thiamine biosynthesis protein ThiS [Desulforamulus reducens MI-1]|uniref:Thiamine biosynthesis protein ThiS n=1 Tax=Desulforamulus reducens (strain ATCC BAA-1160 / DSM 100696 / MI-1) TaxID=349161 RepID=A4J0L9_DESRM|nr:thiamine biosynthesis protein ThiS [Desulforamulus reducens MI-1]
MFKPYRCCGGIEVNIVYNGKVATLPDAMTIGQFIQEKGFNPNTIIIEHNNRLIKKDDWSKLVLQENDQLEVLRFVGGG